jgi:alanine racemase
MHSLMRRAWVEIDLGALFRNGTTIAARAGVPLLPMVKADAYGLGAVPVARALDRLDPWGFGVATLAEGEELRAGGIARPIIVFTPLLPGDFDAAIRLNVTPTFGDAASIERWATSRLPWQLSIDTGMNRAGVRYDALAPLREVLLAHPPQGAFTHFHSAQLPDGSRELQERRFEAAIAELPMRPEMLHAENSAAAEHRAPSRWTVARPGIFLYGVGSGHGAEVVPEPVVSVRARVVDRRTVRTGETVGYDASYRAAADLRVATLGIGYADGYRRDLGNRASVLLNGQRAPVLGFVTMDMTMLDVTNVPCEIGDIATLIGRDGNDVVTVGDVAATADMSPYEILTGLRQRLPRRYVEATD